MDVIQTATPPAYHYMFDANSNSLGGGAVMAVSKYPRKSSEKYMSGFRQFKAAPGRGFVHDNSRANWGSRHYYKFTPIKQSGGASGILQQIEQPNAYKYKVANMKRLGPIDPQLPRGGSIMRVVSTGGDDDVDPRTYDSNYNWSGAQGSLNEGVANESVPNAGREDIVRPELPSNNNWGGPEGSPKDIRTGGDVGRADLPGIEPPTPPPPYTEMDLIDFNGEVMRGISEPDIPRLPPPPEGKKRKKREKRLPPPPEKDLIDFTGIY